MPRRIFYLAVPIMFLAWFFVFAVFTDAAHAATPQITAASASSYYNDWKSTFSWPQTISGENQVLFVTLHGDGDYVSQVLYGDQAMSLGAKIFKYNAYNNLAVFIYYLVNPPVGVHDVQVRLKGLFPFAASAIAFDNLDTANPINSHQEFYFSGIYMSHEAVAIYPNSMLFDAVTYKRPPSVSIAPAPGQTQYFSYQMYGQTNHLYSGDSYKLAGDTGTSTMGWITGDTRTAVHAILVLNPKYKQVEPEPVILIPGILGSWNISGRWQLDPIFHTYDNLMEALAAAGYKENSLGEPKPTLFTFPYDWRLDNNLTAGLLKEKIDLVKQITGRDKVDIIAHSMGGLVARSYIQGDDYQNDVDQVIFLGTPHLGALESYLKYEGAAFVEKWDWLKQYLFQIEAASQGYLDLTDYIRVKVPTVEQLLPVYDYLKDKQADGSWQLRAYPLNYPQNIYLENLNEQTSIDLLKQRVKITNIVSNLGANSTLNFLRVIADPDLTDNKWQSGYPENLDQTLDSLEKGNGDKTVPLSSADSLSGVEIIETNISDHENLPTIMQKQIIKSLTGKEPADYFNSKLTSTFKRWAFFRVYSPVDFAVVAPDGKRIGKDFLSNTEINEIPDAFYSGFDSDSEFVLIPNPMDGEYKVEVQGVDNGGEYTLANSLIDGDKETSVQYTGAISPSIERDFTVNYQASSDNPISELEPIDTVPPVITINKPLEGEKYLRSDNLIIDYTATDDFSGIASISVMIDGKLVATSTIDLFDYSLGMRNLTVIAIDKAGNQAQALVNFQIITDIDSAIIDINEIYQRGWLKDKIYQALLERMFKLLETEAKYFDKERYLNEKSIRKIQDDKELADKQKQKLIEQYNRKLAELKKNRTRTINKSLGQIIRLLDRAKDKELINQPGYDIILNDINYLRENL